MLIYLLQCLAVAWCILGGSAKPPLPMPKYTLVLDDNQIQLAFQYIDRDKDGALTLADLDLLFDHHPEAAPDKQKFLLLLGLNDGKDLTLQKFRNFMNDKTVTYAVFECSYVQPQSLMKVCYEDQIVTYVHLVLPTEHIRRFFRSFNPMNGVITLNEAKNLYTEYNEQVQKDKAQKLLMEIGRGKTVVSEADFSSYVRQEDLHDDFRGCKTEYAYSTTCLKEKLARYATEELTELDIALIFQILDDDADNVVGPSDIAQWCNGCDPEELIKVILMDSYESEIDFGEFRTFVKKSTVKIRIEKKCLGKTNTNRDKMGCFITELLYIVSEHHKPIWLTLPTSDMLFLFEHLDVSDDGHISIVEDLQKVGYSRRLAEKFQREMDADDDDSTVSLQEFYEYVGDPSVVYALAECKMVPRGPSRTTCYTNRLKVYIAFILEKGQVKALFKSYDADNDNLLNEDDMDTVLQNDGLVDLFVKELGMGDNTVNRAEFSWYVKQQEVSEMFRDSRCRNDLVCLQNTLLSYILTRMSEYDIQQLYKAIDKKGKWEFSAADLAKTGYGGDNAQQLSRTLVRRMDTDDDELITYEELRTFLLRKGGKKRFEQECANTKRHGANIHCYLQKIWIL